MEVASLKSAHEVVVIGSCMQDEVQSLAKRNSQIIPIWHADVTASTTSEINLFRANLGLTSRLMMLYSGRAGQNHPLAGLVQSFAEAQNADIDLVVVGQGAGFDEASQLAQDLALRNCHFLPPVPYGDMGKLLRAADWHVASLAVEATGTCVPSKVYASMSVGKPILFLGSADSQAALDIASARAGLVADPTDVTSLRGVIERIASDSTLAGAMGASGQHFFRKNRTVSAGAAAWAAYLKQCESR
jgi:colanic acid biosynthesis glycosyl transferase WcaI